MQYIALACFRNGSSLFATGFNFQMFSHAVKFTIGDIDDEDWLYDEKCGTKDNSCFRKVKAVCSSHDDDCDGETNFTDDKVRHYIIMLGAAVAQW